MAWSRVSQRQLLWSCKRKPMPSPGVPPFKSPSVANAIVFHTLKADYRQNEVASWIRIVSKYTAAFALGFWPWLYSSVLLCTQNGRVTSRIRMKKLQGDCRQLTQTHNASQYPIFCAAQGSERINILLTRFDILCSTLQGLDLIQQCQQVYVFDRSLLADSCVFVPLGQATLFGATFTPFAGLRLIVLQATHCAPFLWHASSLQHIVVSRGQS